MKQKQNAHFFSLQCERVDGASIRPQTTLARVCVRLVFKDFCFQKKKKEAWNTWRIKHKKKKKREKDALTRARAAHTARPPSATKEKGLRGTKKS